MGMSCTFELRQTIIPHCGGITTTVFPRVERWLDVSTDRWEAIAWLAWRKKMDRYRSYMDFLLCEILTEHRVPCFKFYRDKGGPLRDIATRQQIAGYEAVLLVAIRHAYAAFCEKRRIGWSRFRKEVLAIAA